MDGSVFWPLVECGIDVDGITSNPVQCSEDIAHEHNIPFYAVAEIVSNTSCVGRIRAKECRLFGIVITIQPMTKSRNKAGNGIGRHLSVGISTKYGLATHVSSQTEDLLSIRQIINATQKKSDDADEESSSPEVSVNPERYHRLIIRDTHSPQQFNFSVQIIARSALVVAWLIPSRLSVFIEKPPAVQIDPSLSPARLAMRDQTIDVKIEEISSGMTSGNITMRFVNSRNTVIAAKKVAINLTVIEGDIRLQRSTIETSRSSTEDSVFRKVPVSNKGTHNVQWSSRTFLVSGDGLISETSIPWMSFPSEGSLPAATDKLLSVLISPAAAPGLGIFQALVLIETDAWNGDPQDVRNVLDGISIPTVLTSRVSFWIRIGLIVSSIFVCQQFSPITLLTPLGTQAMPLRGVNTEAYPIVVTLLILQLRNQVQTHHVHKMTPPIVPACTLKAHPTTIMFFVRLHGGL